MPRYPGLPTLPVHPSENDNNQQLLSLNYRSSSAVYDESPIKVVTLKEKLTYTAFACVVIGVIVLLVSALVSSDTGIIVGAAIVVTPLIGGIVYLLYVLWDDLFGQYIKKE